jgi:hypothetical protein
MNRATNRSSAPCVPYQEFLAYASGIAQVKSRIATPRAARWFGALTRAGCEWRVAAVDQQATFDFNWRNGSEPLVRVVGKPEMIQQDEVPADWGNKERVWTLTAHGRARKPMRR